MDKYEYLTGEDLGYKASVVEKATLEYSPLVMILTNKAKSKTNKNKVDNKNKKNQDLLYYTSWHSFVKIKISVILKNWSIYKNLNYFHKKFIKVKIVNPQTDENKNLKLKVLDNAEDLFNELDKYNEWFK